MAKYQAKVICTLSWPRNQPIGKRHNSIKMGSLENFKKEQITTDVLDDIPAEMLTINYPSKAVVGLGNELKPTEVKDEPKYSFNGQSDQLYTLVFVDPDAPSRKEPKFRNIVHQLVNNIPGSDVAKGDVAIQYIGSGPPLGTGKHRYIFYVFKQPNNKRIEVAEKTDNTSRKGRLNFDLRKYVAEHNLGKPIAGNFYVAEYDDYVPILHAQLSKS